MIKVNPKSFLRTGAETQTSTMVENLVVNFQTSLQEVEGKPVGMVGSWVFDEQGTNIMGVQKMQPMDGFNADILMQLTIDYIADLKALNPSIEFINTLKA